MHDCQLLLSLHSLRLRNQRHQVRKSNQHKLPIITSTTNISGREKARRPFPLSNILNIIYRFILKPIDRLM